MIKVLMEWVKSETCGHPQLLVQLFKNDVLFLSESEHIVGVEKKDYSVNFDELSYPNIFKYFKDEKLSSPIIDEINFDGYDKVIEFQQNEYWSFDQINN